MRRSFQLGHVFKRGKRRKVWVGRWREPDMVGGQVVKAQRAEILGEVSGMTKAQARAALRERLSAINAGRHSPMQSMAFAEFCEKWRQAVLVTYRESTRAFYTGTLDRWVVPHFSKWRLSEIQTPDVQTFLNRFAEKYSRSVLRHIRATLSRVLGTAVEWQYIERNPISGVKIPRGRAVKRAVVLAPEQIRLILANLKEPYRTMVAIGASLGLRESELLALKWTDFDQLRGVICIARSVYRGNIGTPKTEGSTREIPCPNAVKYAISQLRGNEDRRDGFLFVRRDGRLFRPEGVIRNVFRPLANRLGLPPFTWRSFRRSAATGMHIGGVPLKTQQQVLGHKTADMSLLYTESPADEQRRAVEQWASVLFPSVPKLQPDLQNQRVN